MAYINLMLTTKQKPIVDEYKVKRRKSEHDFDRQNHQFTEGRKRNRKKDNQNTIILSIVNPYPSIITLNLHRLNTTIKKHRVDKEGRWQLGRREQTAFPPTQGRKT